MQSVETVCRVLSRSARRCREVIGCSRVDVACLCSYVYLFTYICMCMCVYMCVCTYIASKDRPGKSLPLYNI